ncbi:MAG: 2Fe-2S iron-sulfur cluster-binding protein [Rhodovarius sp.]|nr:(2Fe-2S)-binding protein [Rhodovarius sp.]MDW8314643.1 2Fe-2S iron-sulfur cluster-binding protein [Rhodovarius sp.]
MTILAGGVSYSEALPDGSNLVVRAGVRKFPWPHLKYKCGMGKCGTCASRVLAGAEHLPEPNWKEREKLGARLAEGWRLMCQLWPTHDLTITQE